MDNIEPVDHLEAMPCSPDAPGSLEDILRSQGTPERPAKAGGVRHISEALRIIAAKHKKDIEDNIARWTEE